VRTIPQAPKVVHAVAARVARGGRMLAVRRPARGLLGGLWDLPGGEVASASRADPRAVGALLRERTGLRVRAVEPVARLDHGFTHRTLLLRLFRCDAEPGRVRLDGWDAHRWVTPRAFAALPIGALARRALARVDHEP
jgi:adenine-specific DNA glycosylase